ncbi:hypothetical protein BJ741DRAFT_415947 [Chytriomyces cf. hyalinus JEL632]|nr:hypothetical protein BJ741DRAFT_415947 [Chytriomyces cf. hyalinus JEL632]
MEPIPSGIESAVKDVNSDGESSSSGSGASKHSVDFAKELVAADGTSAAYHHESDIFEVPVEVVINITHRMDEDDDSESEANDEDAEELKNLQRELEARQAKIKVLLVRKKEAKKAKAEQARLKKEAMKLEIQQLDAVIHKIEEDIEKIVATFSIVPASLSAKMSALVTPARSTEIDQITRSLAQTASLDLMPTTEFTPDELAGSSAPASVKELLSFNDSDFVEENDDDLFEGNSDSEATKSALIDEGVLTAPLESSLIAMPESTEAQNVKSVVIETDAASVANEHLDYADDFVDEAASPSLSESSNCEFSADVVEIATSDEQPV